MLMEFVNSVSLKKGVKIAKRFLKEDLSPQDYQKELSIINTYQSDWEIYEHIMKRFENDRVFERDDFKEKVETFLTAIMGGNFVIRLLNLSFSCFPKLTLKGFIKGTIFGLNWLVGDIEQSGQSELSIPKCKYLMELGRINCIKFCKEPTEEFFKEKIGAVGHLKPDFENDSCLLKFDME